MDFKAGLWLGFALKCVFVAVHLYLGHTQRVDTQLVMAVIGVLFCAYYLWRVSK